MKVKEQNSMRQTDTSRVARIAISLGLIVSAGLTLGACTSVSRALGMQKVSPDEFAIVTKAPLVIPPDYALRPPRPGERDVQDDPQIMAQNALFGPEATPVADGVVTAGEFALLTQSGAGDADPNIRLALSTEASAVTQKDRRFTNQLLFWQANDPNGYDDTAVDAAAEAERIRNNRAAGRPITEGEVPTISKNRGLF